MISFTVAAYVLCYNRKHDRWTNSKEAAQAEQVMAILWFLISTRKEKKLCLRNIKPTIEKEQISEKATAVDGKAADSREITNKDSEAMLQDVVFVLSLFTAVCFLSCLSSTFPPARNKTGEEMDRISQPPSFLSFCENHTDDSWKGESIPNVQALQTFGGVFYCATVEITLIKQSQKHKSLRCCVGAASTSHRVQDSEWNLHHFQIV